MVSVQKTQAMAGACFGMVVPIIIGPCYVIGGPGQVKKRIGEWLALTLGNAVAGAMIYLTCDALITKKTDVFNLTACTALAVSTGFTIIWALEKNVSVTQKFSHLKHQQHLIDHVIPLSD